MNQPVNGSPTISSDASLSAELISKQLDRILASRHFRQTRSLDRFLHFVVTQTLAGAERDLKESLLGREVFHRGNNFDPSTDAVVRVQAGALRKKLASYYASEGALDEVIIDLPKGCYVPTFQTRAALTAEALTPTLALVPAETVLPTQATAETLPALMIEPFPPPRRRWSLCWQTAAAFVVGMALMFGWAQWRSRSTQPAEINAVTIPTKAIAPLWEKFFEPGANTVLAYGTPQFFVQDGLFMRDVRVNSPQEIEQQAGERLASMSKVFKQTLNPVEIYTGVGEAHGIHTLSRFFWQHARELEISRSRLVGWQEAKNSNLIFLSSMRFHTLAEELNYPSDFVIKAGGVSGTILNLNQAEGEQATYGDSGGENYAVITLWPGKADHRRILQLSGNTTWGTLAAAEYATDADALNKLQNHFEQCRQRHGWATHPPYFQVLVRAEVKDNQPITLSYVTHHDLEWLEATTDNKRAALK